MFGHVCLFGSGGPLACLVMFRQNLLRALEFTSHGPMTCLYPV